MKKIYLILALFIFLMVPQNSEAANTTSNNYTYIKNIKNATYKSFRMISAVPTIKKMGGSAKFYSNSKKLSININGKKAYLYINKPVLYLNNKRISISIPPKLINNTPMISINLLQALSGKKLKYSTKTKTLYIFGKLVTNSNTNFKIPKSILNKVIVIDPGHGGKEYGAIYGGISEKRLNLDVSLRLYRLLKKAGFTKVYMTRSSDRTVSLLRRSEIANKVKASLFISVHHNALPRNRLYNGTETLYNPSGATKGNITGKKLAQIIQNELVYRLGTISRGTIPRPNLSVLRHTNMPAILAELGYMTNVSERARMKTQYFKDQSARALFNGIIRALNKM